MNPNFLSGLLVGCCVLSQAGEAVPPHFRAVEIDSHIEIGYAVTVADVDGDHRPDILVVDKKQIVWYRNPTWEKFVITENLTPQDNVCIAAADIDGNGKADLAVGAGWNPSDTLNSGAVFYLIPPSDRTQKWTPVELPHEPTVHRMRWIQDGSGHFELVVAPLHGRGNENGQGNGVRILTYSKPADPHQPWKTELINGSLHMTHNFNPFPLSEEPVPSMLIAAKEGVFKAVHQPSGWVSQQLVSRDSAGTNFNGAGEVRSGKLAKGQPFFTTVEPMHGTKLCVYTPPEPGSNSSFWSRQLLDATLKEGHALACADFSGNGWDQIVIGWRTKNDAGKVGIKIFTPVNGKPEQWNEVVLDDNTMACEDLCVADLNGDGKLDIVASGRATKNVKIYFNEGTR